MTQAPITRELLEQIRQSAWEKSRQDKSRSHHQWLDHLCGPYGYTYTALREHVAKLEEAALAQAMAAEDRIWNERFASSLSWGTRPHAGDQTLLFPEADANHVPWPNCFVPSRLFSLRESGPREMRSGPVFHMEGVEIIYEGEELAIMTDQTLLMALIVASRGVRCGAVVECALHEPQGGGRHLPDLVDSVAGFEIARTLWRLVHCRLVLNDYGFDGPILSYADASRAPDHMAFAFNPDFANFYYPILRIFGKSSGS